MKIDKYPRIYYEEALFPFGVDNEAKQVYYAGVQIYIVQNHLPRTEFSEIAHHKGIEYLSRYYVTQCKLKEYTDSVEALKEEKK